MTHVADVQRSIHFYGLLGLEIRGSLRNQSGELHWVYLHSEQADILFTRGSEPSLPSSQAVLFYLYSPELVERNHLLSNAIKLSEVTYPSYMPKGETRVEDPDGYVFLIGQVG